MKINFHANPEFVPPSNTFSLIPTGDYIVKVIDAEPKRTSTGTGVNLTFQVQEGPYANRRIWVLLNLDHPNEAVTNRANAELQCLCKAVGIKGQVDLEDLKGVPLVARVFQTTPKDGFPAKNGAGRFRAMDPANFMTPHDKLDAMFGKNTEPFAEPPKDQFVPDPRPASVRARELLAKVQERSAR